MSPCSQSETSNQTANTSKHSVSKKSRTKTCSYKPKRKPKKFKIQTNISIKQLVYLYFAVFFKFSEEISHYEIHAHQPYISLSYNNSDKIHIAIQHQDLCFLPAKSSIHICGKLLKDNGNTLGRTEFINSAMSFI